MKALRKIDLELSAWVFALLYLSVHNPAGSSHYSLCPLKLLGFSRCPGCGLGHSIGYLLHGDMVHSFQCHPLGIPALIILLHRIIQLASRYYHPLKITV